MFRLPAFIKALHFSESEHRVKKRPVMKRYVAKRPFEHHFEQKLHRKSGFHHSLHGNVVL